MNLTCIRFEYNDKYTIGKLFVDSVFDCYTLEDKVRREGPKISGETAIPEGTYRVTIDYSPKYDRRMLHILDVPGFSGVRIHSGNTSEDTAGCILIGKNWNSAGTISNSKDAYLYLVTRVEDALDRKEPVFLNITDTDNS